MQGTNKKDEINNELLELIIKAVYVDDIKVSDVIGMLSQKINYLAAIQSLASSGIVYAKKDNELIYKSPAYDKMDKKDIIVQKAFIRDGKVLSSEVFEKS